MSIDLRRVAVSPARIADHLGNRVGLAFVEPATEPAPYLDTLLQDRQMPAPWLAMRWRLGHLGEQTHLVSISHDLPSRSGMEGVPPLG
jgi:hypothetical protein